MPVYACCPGQGATEPWRHGIHVYREPWDIPDDVARNNGYPSSSTSSADPHNLVTAATVTRTTTNDAVAGVAESTAAGAAGNGAEAQDDRNDTNSNHTSTTTAAANNNHEHKNHNNHHTANAGDVPDVPDDDAPAELEQFTPRPFVSMDGRTVTTTRSTTSPPAHNNNSNNVSFTTPLPPPIRRVRHAEIVVADDVCIHHGRYWLRLRWPGHKGGFAGYIAMGTLADEEAHKAILLSSPTHHGQGGSAAGGGGDKDPAVIMDSNELANSDDREDEEHREETNSMPPSEPFEAEPMVGRRTGLPFPSTQVLKLLPYDDGVSPPTSLPPNPTETVFCRICREGLHEDADEEQPAAATDDGANDRDPSQYEIERMNETYHDENDDIRPSDPSTLPAVLTKGPVFGLLYTANQDALQNPMLAPCECSGSMAFVHYLCVEQWRCRSRHPDAQNGLNCETCNTAYSLPPPQERHVPEEQDWLDQMPPHVMQALRQPHLCWQIGTAIVRRRWLRPLAPVLMSPVVALYCRARRLLKKRGVARRRWACSLCRRRARWKCVRCLRSYYCSRQCQNVSWHIIHKHVCYKPVRFWWSVVVYGALTLLLFPGVLRDPLMYDVGACLVPASFVIVGILGGGVATLTKKLAGVDLRGRLMELSVVLGTVWFSVMSWGLVKGFFGDPSACYGTVGSYNVTPDDLASTRVLRSLRYTILKPAEFLYHGWDRFVLSKSYPWMQAIVCTGPPETGCFEHLPSANADFWLAEHGGEACASDLLLFTSLYVLAGVTFAASAMLKHHERQRRRRRPPRGGLLQQQLHMHQD